MTTGMDPEWVEDVRQLEAAEVLLRRYINLPDRDRARAAQLRGHVMRHLKMSDEKRTQRRVAILGAGEEVDLHPARAKRWRTLQERAKAVGVVLITEQREMGGKTYRYVVEAYGSVGTFQTLGGVEMALDAIEDGSF